MGIINAKLRILDKVDNTSDKDKNVAMSTKLQTYNTDKSGTYGTNYPLYCYWTGSYYDITVDNYKTRVDLAKSAESVPLVNVNGLQTALDGKAEKLHNHDYIPLSGTKSLTGDIVPTTWCTINLGSSNYPFGTTYAFNGVFLDPTKGQADTAGIQIFGVPSFNGRCGIRFGASSSKSITLVAPLQSQLDDADDGYVYLPYKSGNLVTDTTITNWNTATTNGFYVSAAGASNAPVSNVGITGNVSATGNMIVQTVYPESNDDTELISYTRKGVKNGSSITWTKWIKDTTLLKTYIIKGHNGAENLFKKLIPSTTNSIIFTNTFIPSDATLIDVDDDGDGGVVAWVDPSNNTKMYVSTQKEGIKVEGNINSSNMFYYCDLVTLDLSNFDTSTINNMSSMFNYCSSLTSLDVSEFDTSNVTDMGYMFNECNELTELNIAKWDTHNVTNMGSMFSGCSKITSLNVSNFDTSKVTSMYMMFSKCSIKELDLINFNTTECTNFQGMFFSCKSLTSLDLSSFDTNNAQYMQGMFQNCTSLISIKVGNKFKWISPLSQLGLSGTWKDETGTTYSSSSTFPSNIAHTYTKVS